MHRAWSITGHRSPPLSLLRMTHPSRDLQDPRYGASDLFSHRASTIKRWRGEGRGGPKNNLAPPSPYFTSSSLHALSNPLDMDTERSDSSALGIMIPGFPRERERVEERNTSLGPDTHARSSPAKVSTEQLSRAAPTTAAEKKVRGGSLVYIPYGLYRLNIGASMFPSLVSSLSTHVQASREDSLVGTRPLVYHSGAECSRANGLL